MRLLEGKDYPEGDGQHEGHDDESSGHSAAVVDSLDVSVLPDDVAGLCGLLEFGVNSVEQVSLREVPLCVLLVLCGFLRVLKSKGLVIVASESDESANWLNDVLNVLAVNAYSNFILALPHLIEVQVDDSSSSFLQ